ncbi:LamG-like jellyroll fold domain-containing protein [Pontibacter sp. MBLB2868]|uniref:LamG-like jellyroll fold domain-containing protein n=1 Tax=Pontibacter sp. MBLB2868 TaxID=3451555 RepID=UPI003F752E38
MRIKIYACLFFSILSICSISSAYAQGPKNALKLDGQNDFVEFSNDNRGITNQLTVETWIKTSSSGHHHIVSKYDRDAEFGFQLLIQNGKAGLAGRDGSGNYRFSGYSSTIVTDNNWHHIAGVVQNGTWMIYVDGIMENQLITGYSATVLASNQNLLIGNYYYVYLGNHFYPGQVDEIKLWKKALTAEEIRQNMCQSISSPSADLVGYFKLNESSGNTVKDYSSLQLSGTLKNVNTSSSWVTSGAPIGDRSVYRYADNWNNSLELITDIANFSISRADAAIKGFHLYQINATPSNTAGLPNAQEIKEYYGLFKVGAPDKKYKIWFKQYNLNCSADLYRRDNNASSPWVAVADTVNAPVLIYHSTENYGEYAAIGKANAPITINGPTTICTGTTASLSVTTDNGTVIWNTGATTKSIQISRSGTYSVTVIENSCERTASITVQEATPVTVDLGADRNLCFGEKVTLSAPAGQAAYKWNTGATSPSITAATTGNYWVEVTNTAGCVTRDEVKITVRNEPKLQWQSETFVCYGKPVTINATVEGATYLWSNGQTTPAIEVTQPGIYKVYISVNGCTMEREAVVSNDECPVIPNIITPNKDGKNDVFVVEGVEPSTLEIEIFNRWGKSIYQSVRYDNGWSADGMPAGLYFYHLKSSRSQNTFRGWLEVIK